MAADNVAKLCRQYAMALIVWVLLIALFSCCVESTMRSAYERGYEVVTLTDCLAATRCGGDLGYESYHMTLAMQGVLAFGTAKAMASA